jgi:hypothetical protein
MIVAEGHAAKVVPWVTASQVTPSRLRRMAPGGPQPKVATNHPLP